MKTFYHVTFYYCVNNIKKYGLLPIIGRLSKKQGEITEKIYLFKNKEDMENALLNWLGDEYDEEKICYLEIAIPDDFPLEENGFECYCYEIIPPNYIKKVVML